jgi:hypothetical protein
MRGAIICSDYAHSSVESAAQAMDVVSAASSVLPLIDSPQCKRRLVRALEIPSSSR